MHIINNSITRYRRELKVTLITLTISLIVWGMVTWETSMVLWRRIELGNVITIIEQILFILIIQVLLYGNFVYQLTRIGYLKRRINHQRASTEELDKHYESNAPSLSILIPTYKEEIKVVERTMLSAALQDYPKRRISLLIDDPPTTQDPLALKALDDIRRLPKTLQANFNEMALPFISAFDDFELCKLRVNIDLSVEVVRLADLNNIAADSIDSLASCFAISDHADMLLQDKVFRPISSGLRQRALKLTNMLNSQSTFELEQIQREYYRLSCLFTVEFTSFERKRYVNLSHEPNKAMNLNSYIGLMGEEYSKELGSDGRLSK